MTALFCPPRSYQLKLAADPEEKQSFPLMNKNAASPIEQSVTCTQSEGFVDKNSGRVENDFMSSRRTANAFRLSLLMGSAILTFSGTTIATASAASPLYWCPDRKADQQYSATKSPGCMPLAEKKKTETTEQTGEPAASDQQPRDFKVENLQREVSTFLNRYRLFLACCKTDPDELQQIEELGDEVGELLAATQANLSNYALAARGIMLRELITPVAKARADLKTLRARLEQIGESSGRLRQADAERAGREIRKIQELEESIDQDIHAPQLPGGAKTGADIGVAPAVGPNIGKTPRAGSAIGSEGRTGQDIGVSPRSSRDIGTSGPSGFDIGATGRAGPAIGESTLNNETSSGVNSSLQRSTVGSSLQERPTGPQQ